MKRKNICTGKNLYYAFFLVFILFGAGSGFLPARNPTVYKASFEEFPIDNSVGEIGKMAWLGDKLYILDSENHRIVIVKDNKISGTIGVIGNAEGELFHPADFCLDINSCFYILDKGNNRIQALDSNGKFLGAFPEKPAAFRIAVNSKQHVLLGQPLINKAVSGYNLEGRRILKFGTITKPSDYYLSGAASPTYNRPGRTASAAYKGFAKALPNRINKKKFDKKYWLAMNRVHLTVDKQDNIWSVYVHMLLICKYNHDGELIFKKTLHIPNLEPLLAALRQEPPPPEYISIGGDGVTLTMITRDIAYETGNDLLYLLMGDNRIVVLDAKGKESVIIEPGIVKGAVEKMCVDKNSDIYVSFFFSNKIYKLIIDK